MGWDVANEVRDKMLAPHAPSGRGEVDILFDPPSNRSKMFDASLLSLDL